MRPDNKMEPHNEVNIQIQNKVSTVINRMRAYLQADGGDIKLIEITPEGIVKVKLLGACKNCPYRKQTLAGIEQAVIKEVSQIKKLEAINL